MNSESNNHSKPPYLLPFEGRWPTIASDVFVAENARVIGDVEIGSESSIWFQCTVRGDVNEIRIGEQSNIQDGTIIHVASLGQGTYIGNGVTVGHAAILHACTIDDDSFIGIQACVMDDCEVQSGAMVAAGALVTPGKVVPSGELWAGRPAKKLRDLSDKDYQQIQINRERYVGLAKQYL